MYSLDKELEFLEQNIQNLNDSELIRKFDRIKLIAKLFLINVVTINADDTERLWLKKIFNSGISKRPLKPLDNFPECWVLIPTNPTNDIFEQMKELGFTHYHTRYERLFLHETGFCAFLNIVHYSIDGMNWNTSEDLNEIVKITEFPCFPPEEKYLIIEPGETPITQIKNGNYREIDIDA